MPLPVSQKGGILFYDTLKFKTRIYDLSVSPESYGSAASMTFPFLRNLTDQPHLRSFRLSRYAPDHRINDLPWKNMDNDVTVIHENPGRTRISLDLFGLKSRFV